MLMHINAVFTILENAHAFDAATWLDEAAVTIKYTETMLQTKNSLHRLIKCEIGIEIITIWRYSRVSIFTTPKSQWHEYCSRRSN